MNIINTEILNDFEIKEEVAEGTENKNMYIEGIFMQSEVRNRNQRMYPKSVLQEAVDHYSKNQIANNQAIGEMGHPKEPGVDFQRACILCESLIESGNDFIGKAKVLKSVPLGQLLEGLINDGVRIGVSSRGRGKLDKKGIIQPGFRLVTAADVVADPSAPNAFVNAITESQDWLIQESMMTEEEFDSLRESIGYVAGPDTAKIEQQKLELFQRFLKKF